MRVSPRTRLGLASGIGREPEAVVEDSETLTSSIPAAQIVGPLPHNAESRHCPYWYFRLRRKFRPPHSSQFRSSQSRLNCP